MTDDSPVQQPVQPQPVRCVHCGKQFPSRFAGSAHLKSCPVYLAKRGKPATNSATHSATQLRGRRNLAAISQEPGNSTTSAIPATLAGPLSISLEKKDTPPPQVVGDEGVERAADDPYMQPSTKSEPRTRGYLAQSDDPEEDAPQAIPRLSRKAAKTLWFEKNYRSRYEPYLQGIFAMWVTGSALTEKQEGIVGSILAQMAAEAEQEAEILRQALADKERADEKTRHERVAQERREQEEAEDNAERDELRRSLEETGQPPAGWVKIHNRHFSGGGYRWVPPDKAARYLSRATTEAEDAAFMAYTFEETVTTDAGRDDNEQEERRETAILERNTDNGHIQNEMPAVRRTVERLSDC